VINNQVEGNNEANFGTPSDGQAGIMNLFTWTTARIRRDGSLDNSIPIHEYSHGLSNRLTGGPKNIGCLTTLESGAMGEGWGDAFAMFFQRKKQDTRATDFAMGAFATNQRNGIRSFPYSTNLQTNPLTYRDLARRRTLHPAGEIWASMLNEVYWNLVDQFGFSDNWYDATQRAGNIMALQLFVEGMKIQPCNPTFLQARDAILQADRNIYNGALRCYILRGFAKRGLGTNAVRKGITYVNGDSTCSRSGWWKKQTCCSSAVNNISPATTNVLNWHSKRDLDPKTLTQPPQTLSQGPTPKIVFEVNTARIKNGPIRIGQLISLEYNMGRLSGLCEQFTVCTDTFETRETCLSQPSGDGGVKSFQFQFTYPGPNLFRFKTNGPGCAFSDTDGSQGYVIQVEQ
jgi:hypothetical protein